MRWTHLPCENQSFQCLIPIANPITRESKLKWCCVHAMLMISSYQISVKCQRLDRFGGPHAVHSVACHRWSWVLLIILCHQRGHSKKMENWEPWGSESLCSTMPQWSARPEYLGTLKRKESQRIFWNFRCFTPFESNSSQRAGSWMCLSPVGPAPKTSWRIKHLTRSAASTATWFCVTTISYLTMFSQIYSQKMEKNSAANCPECSSFWPQMPQHKHIWEFFRVGSPTIFAPALPRHQTTLPTHAEQDTNDMCGPWRAISLAMRRSPFARTTTTIYGTIRAAHIFKAVLQSERSSRIYKCRV